MRSQCISRPRVTSVFADHRNIVFRLACDDASVAADAGVYVDGHAPGVTLIFVAGIQRAFRLVMAAFASDEVRVLPVLLNGRGANQIAAFHAVMKLRAGKRILGADFTDLHSGPIAGRICGSNRIGIEAGAVSDFPRTRAAVTQDGA